MFSLVLKLIGPQNEALDYYLYIIIFYSIFHLLFVGELMAMVGQRPRRVEVTAVHILLTLVVVLSDLSISARAEKSVAAFVQNAILSNKIVIFSKSYCP